MEPARNMSFMPCMFVMIELQRFDSDELMSYLFRKKQTATVAWPSSTRSCCAVVSACPNPCAMLPKHLIRPVS